MSDFDDLILLDETIEMPVIEMPEDQDVLVLDYEEDGDPWSSAIVSARQLSDEKQRENVEKLIHLLQEQDQVEQQEEKTVVFVDERKPEHEEWPITFTYEEDPTTDDSEEQPEQSPAQWPVDEKKPAIKDRVTNDRETTSRLRAYAGYSSSDEDEDVEEEEKMPTATDTWLKPQQKVDLEKAIQKAGLEKVFIESVPKYSTTGKIMDCLNEREYQLRKEEKKIIKLLSVPCHPAGKRCMFCDLRGHWPDDCRRVRTSEERIRCALRQGRCLKCSFIRHRPEGCTKADVKCPLCCPYQHNIQYCPLREQAVEKICEYQKNRKAIERLGDLIERFEESLRAEDCKRRRDVRYQ